MACQNLWTATSHISLPRIAPNLFIWFDSIVKLLIKSCGESWLQFQSVCKWDRRVRAYMTLHSFSDWAQQNTTPSNTDGMIFVYWWWWWGGALRLSQSSPLLPEIYKRWQIWRVDTDWNSLGIIKLHGEEMSWIERVPSIQSWLIQHPTHENCSALWLYKRGSPWACLAQI